MPIVAASFLRAPFLPRLSFSDLATWLDFFCVVTRNDGELCGPELFYKAHHLLGYQQATVTTGADHIVLRLTAGWLKEKKEEKE